MEYKPLYDNVVVQVERVEESDGGIALVGAYKPMPTQGVVLSVGSGKVDNRGVVTPNKVVSGDNILFSETSAWYVEKEGTVMFIKDSEIMGRVCDGNVVALNDKILATDMKMGERKVGSIVLTDDLGKTHGIRPRWFKVYSVGDDVNNVKVGQWLLVQYGRWTHQMKVDGLGVPIWGIDYPNGVLMTSDEEPADTEILDSMEYGYKTLGE